MWKHRREKGQIEPWNGNLENSLVHVTFTRYYKTLFRQPEKNKTCHPDMSIEFYKSDGTTFEYTTVGPTQEDKYLVSYSSKLY